MNSIIFQWRVIGVVKTKQNRYKSIIDLDIGFLVVKVLVNGYKLEISSCEGLNKINYKFNDFITNY